MGHWLPEHAILIALSIIKKIVGEKPTNNTRNVISCQFWNERRWNYVLIVHKPVYGADTHIECSEFCKWLKMKEQIHFR